MSKDLKNYYGEVYSKDKNTHFLKYRDGKKLSESHEWVLSWLKTSDLKKELCVDFGCGEGDFLDALEGFGKRVGVDFSEEALKTARTKYPKVDFVKGDEKDMDQYTNKGDLVVSFGTLEHTDNPFSMFQQLVDCTKEKSGYLIVSCPSFLNVRGIIWMTLVKLFDVPMSLSDKHFLGISEFKKFAQLDGRVEMIDYKSTDFAVSYGDYLFTDMKKRLTNALRDAKLPNNKVDDLLAWLEQNLEYLPANEFSGVEGTYIFKRN